MDVWTDNQTANRWHTCTWQYLNTALTTEIWTQFYVHRLKRPSWVFCGWACKNSFPSHRSQSVFLCIILQCLIWINCAGEDLLPTHSELALYYQWLDLRLLGLSFTSVPRQYNAHLRYRIAVIRVAMLKNWGL